MDLLKRLKKLHSDEHADGEFSSLYMLVIFAIAAVLVIALVKPMFKASQQIVQQNPVVAAQNTQSTIPSAAPANK